MSRHCAKTIEETTPPKVAEELDPRKREAEAPPFESNSNGRGRGVVFSQSLTVKVLGVSFRFFSKYS